ncbi:hypothetical protein P8C59_001537 [Phyllachora maydis]|uniref:HIG1 domain-containing protein n=1 Tax=Phyllachora maydis TaxID=1825666 RepID=A0AAD9MCD9_9PEZI|nr:hypothetical protein P8C59_001537 [Phyllachora maydis]
MASKPPPNTLPTLASRPLPSSFDEDVDNPYKHETTAAKVLRKFKEEPLIPLGTALTIAAFAGSYRAFRRGDHWQVQYYFRARIAFQAFTIAAVVFGGWYYAEDRSRAQALKKQRWAREADEKRQRWIRELEARDEEDRAVRELMDKKKRKAAERAAAAAAAAASRGEEEGAGPVMDAVRALEAEKAAGEKE